MLVAQDNRDYTRCSRFVLMIEDTNNGTSNGFGRVDTESTTNQSRY